MAPAQASRLQPEIWLYEPEAFSQMDYAQRYARDGLNAHINQWNEDDWAPEDWVRGRGGVSAVLQGLFASDILRSDDDLYDSDPRLVVGQRFMTLSEQDQIRVARFVDYAYGISQTRRGSFLLVHEPTCARVGFYSDGQLQLQ